jgi:hypothetical protein
VVALGLRDSFANDAGANMRGASMRDIQLCTDL